MGSASTRFANVQELASDDAEKEHAKNSRTLNNDDKAKIVEVEVAGTSCGSNYSDNKDGVTGNFKSDGRNESADFYQCDSSEVEKEPVLVIAIDFGTTFTGYAFSFRDKRDEIQTALHGCVLEDDRVPTVMLLNSDQTFNSFGYEAIEKYTQADMSADERESFFYIEYFKMAALYRSQNISRTTTIRDNRNREVNALKVFTMAIKYFRDLAFEITNKSILNLEKDHVQWILTIPAIWTDSARQFMREAAVGAGITEDKLRLVLEPEAASLFFQETKIVITEKKLEKLPVGHKYILADLGGGTADICVHEVLEGGKLCELYMATGGDYGGHSVNQAFIEFMTDLVGKQIWNAFEVNFIKCYFDMMKKINSMKKSFSMKRESVTFVPEFALLNMLEKKGQSLGEILRDKPYNDLVAFKEVHGHLVIKKEKMESFFIASVNGIINTLREIIQSCADPDIKSLILVGGFAESPYVRERIMKEFPRLRVILYPDTRLAVLKGAVMMGYMPRNIVQRRAMYTYGFRVFAAFDAGIDPESTKRIRDGEDRCEYIFKKMIEKNQKLTEGDTFVHKGHATAASQCEKRDRRQTELWRSTRTNPRYCMAEEGCEMVGQFSVLPPLDGWPDYDLNELHMIVGETEFTVKYVNKTTGNVIEANMDFLSLNL